MSVAPLTKSERRAILFALMAVFLLGALDNTVVATAMPRIIERLQGFRLYAWVTTAYLLTSTVMVPVYGSLSASTGESRFCSRAWCSSWVRASVD